MYNKIYLFRLLFKEIIILYGFWKKIIYVHLIITVPFISTSIIVPFNVLFIIFRYCIITSESTPPHT